MNKLAIVAYFGLLSLGLSAVAHADSGVSDERVSLPDGPGSIGGVGENASVDPNMGSMSYSVRIQALAGFPAATPSLALSYSSAMGNSELGMGWAMGVPTIERMTLHGLPEYDEDDEFAAGGAQLVRVDDVDGTAAYRSRYEGGFVRYRWYDRGDGSGGYFTAELPDGTVQYYGADETGALVANARVTGAAGVFKYYLVAQQDVFGHVLRYGYVKDGEWPLVDEIGYVFSGGTTPRFSVRFGYESRPDPISTGEPGFLLELGQRLNEVRVVSGSETIRRYLLSYEATATSGGASRLAGVEQRGVGDATTPIRFSFGYSRSLDGSCDGDCQGPFMVDMGTLPDGINLANGRATLLDIDGNSLPDVLSTSTTGRHTWVRSTMDAATGIPSFAATATGSAATTSDTSFILNAPGVQVLDVNGDGFTDIISSRSGGQVLCNDGSGDWNGSACLMDATLPQFDADTAGDANPRNVRFLDYDDDKRIDVIRTQLGTTEVFTNTGTGFSQQTVQDIGAQFDVSPTLQLTDMNGDGLQDPVEILGRSSLRYRLNLGWGQWTDWTSITMSGFGDGDVPLMQLEDLNGDGLADIVVVSGSQVMIATNRGGSFDAAETLVSGDVDGSIPSRASDTVVLFADMNGNGSRDVVWFRGSKVDFLELYPTKPNLIARIDNGIGGVQLVEYGSSVLQQAADSEAWTHSLPNAMNIVTGTDSFVTLTGSEDGSGLHERTEYVYRDGYYDGVEKSFRGFAHVERRLLADMSSDSQDPGLTVFDYDVGASDPYRFGLLLSQYQFGGADGSVPLNETHSEYERCALAEVPAAVADEIQWQCMTSGTLVVQEGAPSAEWVTQVTELEYGGYGGQIRLTRHGVSHLGPPSAPTACGACSAGSGPCGADCTGDEMEVEITLIDPGTTTTDGRWILNMPSRHLASDGVGEQAETLFHYDGDAFVGLPSGQLTLGQATRQRNRVSSGSDDFSETSRFRFDTDGNTVESLSPMGDLDEAENFRKVWTYDASGLNAVRSELLLRDTDGAPVRLRSEVVYEATFNLPSEVTDWMLVEGGSATTARNSSRIRYDEMGRSVASLEPGDADATPGATFEYQLGGPVSRVSTYTRSQQNGAVDGERIQCLDGVGRTYQTRTRVSSGSFQVDGYREFNRRGSLVTFSAPYLSTSAGCDTSPPSESLITHYRFDALGRQTEETIGDEALFGTASTTRTERLPLTEVFYDAADMDSGSPHFDTPTTRRRDGLGRMHSIERMLAGGEVATTRLGYDSTSSLVSVVDPMGNERTQEFDLLGRTTAVLDPNSGRTTYEYDTTGSLIARTDAVGRTARFAYDGLSRLVREWEDGAEATTTVTRTWDADPSCPECEGGVNRLVSIDYPLGDGRGRDELGYDARGRTVFEARTIEGFRFVTERAYDNSGMPTRTTFPDGTVLTRRFDDASRLTSIDGFVDGVAYTGQSLLGTTTYANGVREQRSYGFNQRLDELSHLAAGGAVLDGGSFERNRLGHVLSETDLAEVVGRPTRTAAYTYDAWYRATGAAFADSGEAVAYAFDTIDNVTSRVSSLGAASRAHVGDYEYGSSRPNAVTRAGDISYDYDASGQMIARGVRSYSWDHLGRMDGATPETGTATSFEYGPGANRIVKLEDGGVTFYIGPELEVRDGIVNVYPRFGRGRLARVRSDVLQTALLSDVAPLTAPDDEINAADAWIAFAGAEGIVAGVVDSSTPTRLLRGAARRLLLEDGEDLVFLHRDRQGSAVMATDSSGDVVGRQLFYPMGAIRHADGFVDEHGFTGQEQDASTGLHAFMYRSYDAGSGRWASSDPLFRVQTSDSLSHLGEATGAYTYVAGTFVNQVDPTGLDTGRFSGSRHRQSNAKNQRQHRARERAGRRARDNANARPVTNAQSNPFRSGTRTKTILTLSLAVILGGAFSASTAEDPALGALVGAGVAGGAVVAALLISYGLSRGASNIKAVRNLGAKLNAYESKGWGFAISTAVGLLGGASGGIGAIALAGSFVEPGGDVFGPASDAVQEARDTVTIAEALGMSFTGFTLFALTVGAKGVIATSAKNHPGSAK